jgi:hypothetical protein
MARAATSGQKKPTTKPVAKPVTRTPLAATVVVRKVAAPKPVAAKLHRLQLEGLTDSQKVTALLQDRARLLKMLTGLEARVQTLEQRKTQVTDRITWALDTLNDMLREKA